VALKKITFLLCLAGTSIFAQSRPATDKNRSRRSKLVAQESPQAERPREEWLLAWTFSALSWQDEMRLTGAGVDLEAITTQITACAGLSTTYAFSNYEFVTNLCGFLGQGEAGLLETTSSYKYQVETATVFGARVMPAIYWYPTPMKHLASLGLGVPVLVRTGNWPQPGNGLEFGPKVKVVPAFVLAGRFELGAFMLTAESGFFNSFRTFQWNIGMAYRL